MHHQRDEPLRKFPYSHGDVRIKRHFLKTGVRGWLSYMINHFAALYPDPLLIPYDQLSRRRLTCTKKDNTMTSVTIEYCLHLQTTVSSRPQRTVLSTCTHAQQSHRRSWNTRCSQRHRVTFKSG